MNDHHPHPETDDDDAPGMYSYCLLRSRPAAEWFSESANDPPPRRLLGDLWLEGELCVLFGDTGRGKSVFATQVADAIARGAAVPPFAAEVPPQKVLYFDFEMTTAQFAARYSAAGKVHPFSPNLIRVEMLAERAQPDDFDFKNFASHF